MTKGAMAALSAGVAVFGFDPEPGTPASRALHVLTLKRTLPTGDLGPKERFPEAALRAAAEAGIDLGGRRGARGGQRLHLVGVDDDPARARSVTVWYYAARPYGPGQVRVSGLRRDEGCISTQPGRQRCARPSTGCAPTPGSSPVPPPWSATSSPGTTCFGSMWRSTAAPRAASGPSAVASRSCAIRACSSPCGTPRWLRCGSESRASDHRPGPVAGLPKLLRYSGAGGEDEQLAALRARRAG